MAKREARLDPGLSAVKKLYRQMKINEPWSLWSARGYTWWGHELRDGTGPRRWLSVPGADLEGRRRDGPRDWPAGAERLGP